jgi:hypothetical protein
MYAAPLLRGLSGICTPAMAIHGSIQDIGASVLNGAISTSLAVAVLLFSKSHVFKTHAIQFALIVSLGDIHCCQFFHHCLGLNHLPPQKQHK